MAPLRGMSVTWTLAINRERAKRPAVNALAMMICSQAEILIKDGLWWKVTKRVVASPSSNSRSP